MSDDIIPDPTTTENKGVVAKPVAPQPQGIRKGLPPRTVKRLAIMGVILVALIYGFYWFVGQKGDIILGSDTSGMISAIKLQDQGSQAVVIDQSGKVTESPNYVVGKSDRDLAWDPAGNRLFFISDRKDESFHIFRWDPQRSEVAQKSIDRAGRSSLVFDSEDNGSGELVGLVLVRGTVQEFTPKTAKSRQVMPPTTRGQEDSGSGSSSTFELIYKRHGRSFKAARWFGNRRYVAAVMNREDRGQSLIVQDSLPDEEGKTKPPKLIFLGEKINIAVDPITGNLIFTIAEILPILDQDGKPVKGPDDKPIIYEFSHGIFMLNVTDGKFELQPIGTSPQKDICFGNPVPSPDGKNLMFLVGKYSGEGNMEITSLESCDLAPSGVNNHQTIAPGSVADPSYSKDGNKILYVKEDAGKQAIFMANKDGSDAKNLTGSSGDYASPLFSPQFK